LVFILISFDQSKLGLNPGEWPKSWGIFTCPFVHADVNHILYNSGSLYLFFALLFSLYKKVAIKVSVFCWFYTGLLMFLFARQGYVHIGASGVVYALAAFLVAAGFLAKSRKLRNVSYLVIVYFGSMIWGLLPYDSHISWDGHLSGVIAGLAAAFIYRRIYKRAYADVLPEWHADDDEKHDEYARFGSSGF
jgi:membrane associated rhomboid family serine protease